MNAPTRPPLILTDAQFEDMARKGAFAKVGRVELRRGMIEVMSPVHLNHSTIMFALARILASAIEREGLALLVNPEVSVAFGKGFQPTCDIVVWRDVGDENSGDGPVPGAVALLVVEVADTSLSDDLGEKMQDYARAGLPEYWVVDVKGRVIFRHSKPGGDGYAGRDTIRFGEPLESLTLPLALDTGAL